MKLKAQIQRNLQTILGFRNYLFLFSIYKIKTIKKYEPGFNLFMRLIPTQGSILDIGANIGITAIPLAKKFDKSTIYAFEPIHENFLALTRVIKFFKVDNIITSKSALGETKGSIKMVMPVIAGVKKQGLSKLDDNNTEGVIEEVMINPVDSQSFKDKVVAIKIDVEGHELEVLKGARKLLLADRPIIYCELWDNHKRTEAIAYMEDLGYVAYVYDEETDSLSVYKQQIADNFFFVTA